MADNSTNNMDQPEEPTPINSALDLASFRSNFDRGRPRIVEMFWILAKCLFFVPSFPVPSKLRAMILRLFGAKIGKGLVIRSGTKITFPWRLTIGDHVWIGEDCMLLNLEHITIDSNCCISQKAFLCTGSHDFRKSRFDLITKPIHIHKGSWVCAQAFVGPGVEIGSSTMVSASCVVTKNVPSNTICIGNPAQMKTRS